MKIAVEGCAHGELEKIYDTIEGIEKAENIKIDLLLCCGDFQSTRNLQDLTTMAVPKKYMDICTFYKYYSGERVAPVLTIFIGGNHEASNYLQELPYGGWVAPNIYYLGYAGVIQVNGIRIAGISGIYKGHDFLRGHHEFPPYTDSTCRSVYHVRQLEVFRLKQLSGKVDIFLSHDWPRGIWDYGNKAQLIRFKPYFEDDMESGKLGSRPLEELLYSVQPDYWFAAHLHCKFAALVTHRPAEAEAGESGSDSDKEQSLPSPAVTKFLALDKCLPKRRFLQLVDVPATKEPLDNKPFLEYDAEWLAILLTSNHLISVKNNNYFLPGKRAGCTERHNFTPTPEELALVNSKFSSLEIPQNFCRTAEPYDANSQSNYKHSFIAEAKPQLNPQCTEFCSKLGIDDPLCLAMLASGIDMPPLAEIIESRGTEEPQTEEPITLPSNSTEDVEMPPIKRKFNLSLPAPVATKTIADENVIELPEETLEDEEATAEVEEVKETTPELAEASQMETISANLQSTASPNIKKFKRRNQNIYQAEDNDE